MRGMKIIHLTTVGRVTGKPHWVELYCFFHKDKPVIIASYGGKDEHPQWFLNLKANPAVHVKIGKDSYNATAKIAGPKLRATLWEELSQRNSHYEGFQRKTQRTIPMVVLHHEAA
ncbi:MAG: nitroreductase family deazaflavin-dependent oxidoreductase [Anaerolineales bacterium]|nr:MAG: nitroreductase family deazaflavin-dependent oxidoreductase [Anaerolineales bacterium]